jgi:hypothetical protein
MRRPVRRAASAEAFLGRALPFGKTQIVLFFQQCSSPSRLAGAAARAFDEREAKKLGGKRNFLFCLASF